MTHDEFKTHFDVFVKTLENLGTLKGGEYSQATSGNRDRLSNFYRGAALTGSIPEQVCLVYMAKHWDSVGNYVKAKAAGIHVPLSEPISSRLHDLALYCILLDAIIRESDKITTNIPTTLP